MESIKQHLDILECFLPRVMNCIVVEYMFSTYIEKKIFTKKINHKMDVFTIIKNNNVYVFDRNTIQLKMFPINNYNIINTLDVSSFAFDEKSIYVHDQNNLSMYIFNERCEKIRSIKINTRVFSWFVILNNMIYMRIYKNIIVFNMSGECVNNMQFTHEVYNIQTANSYLYVLLSNNTILQLLNNGDIVDERFFDGQLIISFNVIDDEIYIIYYSMDDVFVYDFSGNVIRKIIINKPYMVNTDKNMLYIHNVDVTPYKHLLHQYSREKINVYKKS